MLQTKPDFVQLEQNLNFQKFYFKFVIGQVEGLVDLLQKEPGPFKSPPLSPPDGNLSSNSETFFSIYLCPQTKRPIEYS